MLVSKAARRYAIALLELAEEQNSVEQTLDDISLIRNTIDGSRELYLFLKSPIVKPDKKAATLDELFGEKVDELTRKFVKLITRKKRADILDEIVEAFVEEYNKFAGIIEVEAFVAQPLDDEQIAELRKVLEKTTGKKVELKVTEQPDLKGGIAVKIDDTVIDGSVKHKLEQLEHLFLETSVE